MSAITPRAACRLSTLLLEATKLEEAKVPNVGISRESAEQFFNIVGKGTHDLANLSLFDDEQLAELLDNVPRQHLQVFTMGDDPASTTEWRRGELGDLKGCELIAAAKRGRLWFNVVRVDQVDSRFEVLLTELFEEIQSQVPSLEVESKRATLLISSPGAQVYYHADAQPNLLWHVRGRKTVWAYPALDERFVSQRALGKIFTGEADEQLPYDPNWDQYASVVDLNEGEFAWWPQNAPHRVMNVEGFNISLSTEYTTAASNRRVNVRAANQILCQRWNRRWATEQDSSRLAAIKVFAYRAGRRTGLTRVPTFKRPASFVVSVSDPRGFSDDVSTSGTVGRG